MGQSPLKWILLAIVGVLTVLAETGGDDNVTVHFRNQSGVRIQIGWLDEDTGRTTLLATLGTDEEYSVLSYEGEEFKFREEASAESGECSSEEGCLTGNIRLSSRAKQYFVVDENLEMVEHIPGNQAGSTLLPESGMNHTHLFAKCRTTAQTSLESESESGTARTLEEFERCLSLGLTPRFHHLTAQIRFDEMLRTRTSDKIENYTCVDSEVETSPDIEEKEWTDPRNRVSHPVHIKLDRPTGKIHVIENFASADECKEVEEQAAGRLEEAVTEDGQGGTEISKYRKAMQAQIYPEWDKESDPVSQLDRRIYDYTNHILGLNLTYHGQEPLMSIQYSGRGRQETKPDQYLPHCDGQCDGEALRVGGRIATMVVYCTVPTQGGFTSFANGNVIVRPQLGSGIFFSYLDPLTNQTDNQLTKHSGCPVFEGEKKIATQWVRLGVDDTISYEKYNACE